MELRDLRYFVTVAEHQNIGRAADALDLSATALGKSLRRLEKSVGARLVERSQKGVALTAVGVALLNRIGPLQGMLNDVRHEAANLSQGHAGHLFVGVNNGTAENFMAAACAALRRQGSSLTIKVTVAVSGDFKTAMNKGKMDFCVSHPVFYSPVDYVHEHLFDTQYVIFASAAHTLAKRRQVPIKDLAPYGWASLNNPPVFQWQALLRAYSENQLPPPVVALETNSQSVRLSAIAYSNYLGICTRHFLRQESRRYPLVELPVQDHLPTYDFAIVYRKGAYLSPAAQRLIDILKVQAKEMRGIGSDNATTLRT